MKKIALAAAITLVGALGIGPSSLTTGATAYSSGCTNTHNHAAYNGSTLQQWTDTRRYAWNSDGANYYGFTTYYFDGYWEYTFKYGGGFC
jgi:hypothetical protein